MRVTWVEPSSLTSFRPRNDGRGILFYFKILIVGARLHPRTAVLEKPLRCLGFCGCGSKVLETNNNKVAPDQRW